MKFRHVLACLVIAGFVSTFFGTAVLGQKKMKDPNISYRQKVMKSNLQNLLAIFDIVKKKVPHTGNLALHAQNLNNGSKMILAAFKQRVVDGPTDAKPKIWGDADGFKKRVMAFQEASAMLAKAGRSMDKAAFGAALKKTGKSCASCHKNFRKGKKDSYKRKKM